MPEEPVAAPGTPVPAPGPPRRELSTRSASGTVVPQAPSTDAARSAPAQTLDRRVRAFTLDLAFLSFLGVARLPGRAGPAFVKRDKSGQQLCPEED